MERSASYPDVTRAIRRSRAARSAMHRRRRNLAAGVAAAILVGSGTLLSLVGVSGSDAVAAATHQAQNLAQLLDQRSPGERVAGAQTKHKRVQRALAKPRLRARPAAPSTAELAKILMPTQPVGPAEVAPPVLAANAPIPTLGDIVALGGGGGPAIVGAPGGGGGETPGGGGGTPGGGTPGTDTPGSGVPMVYPPHDDKTPTPAVPEPATWMMMLLGFGLIGWRVRNGSARQHALA